MISNKHYNEKREITYEYLNSLNGFAESFSGFACGVATFSFLSRIKVAQTGIAKYMAIKPTCVEILTQVVNPITSYLRDRAIVRDMNIVTLKLKSSVKKSLLKLATAQETLSFELRNVDRRDYDPFGDIKLFNLGKIEWSSKSKLSAYVEATMIAGFDLSKYFSMSVNHKERILTITLPEPNLIANNVSIFFRKPNKEWGSPEINSDTYNKISRKAKEVALNKIKDSELYDMAKENAHRAIMNIFESLMELPQFNYKVEVYFNNYLYRKNSKEE